MSLAYRLLSLLGLVNAARRGPGAVVKREVRRRAHRSLARGLRGWL